MKFDFCQVNIKIPKRVKEDIERHHIYRISLATANLFDS